jgi:hypothetical protein
LNRSRVGGTSGSVSATNGNHLFRIDGAWFVCFDHLVGPVKGACNVLSFGISSDESFDLEMNEKYGCNVHSFDPNIETTRFMNARAANPKQAGAVSLEMNKRWHYYKIGLVGNKKLAKESVELIKKGEMATIEQIFELTGTKNKVVDIWKMDIEGYKRPLFENLDVDYVCKYVKQLMFETHWVSALAILNLPKSRSIHPKFPGKDLGQHEYYIAFELLAMYIVRIASSKADKGNAVVIQDRSEYVSKITKLLNDSSKFKQLDSNVTLSRENKLRNYLYTLLERWELDEKGKPTIRVIP